jgi:hypothetical protein
MGLIALFREAVLGPMLHRRSGRPQRGVRKIEQDGEAADALLAVVADHGKGAVSAALTNAAWLYIELRNDQPPKVIMEIWHANQNKTANSDPISGSQKSIDWRTRHDSNV